MEVLDKEMVAMVEDMAMIQNERLSLGLWTKNSVSTLGKLIASDTC